MCKQWVRSKRFSRRSLLDASAGAVSERAAAESCKQEGWPAREGETPGCDRICGLSPGTACLQTNQTLSCRVGPSLQSRPSFADGTLRANHEARCGGCVQRPTRRAVGIRAPIHPPHGPGSSRPAGARVPPLRRAACFSRSFKTTSKYLLAAAALARAAPGGGRMESIPGDLVDLLTRNGTFAFLQDLTRQVICAQFLPALLMPRQA